MSILVALKLDAFPSSFFIRSIVKTNNESSPSFHIKYFHRNSHHFNPATHQRLFDAEVPSCVETSCGVGEVGIDVGEFQIQVLRWLKIVGKKNMAQIRALTKQTKQISTTYPSVLCFIGFYLLRLGSFLAKLHGQGTKWTLIRLDTAKSSICSRLKSLT